MKPCASAAILVWIGGCAFLNCAGWILSALHELNAAGYAVVLASGLIALAVWRQKNPPRRTPQARRQILCRRFRRPLPVIFLLAAALILAGGALYAPNNYDALTYRLPRMLNWLAAGHWIWIPTINDRMNFSGTAWEWTAMPFLALLRSDRGLFLINWIGFLLMPGLVFSVFRQLGVARRVAWTWMWILPLAYGYATQAGSIGNDFTGTLFALISVYYGLRARRSHEVKDVWLAMLAAALMTGAKISNLPLLLPCLVAVWPALIQLRRHWVVSMAVLAAAGLISAGPIIVLNQLNTGSWNGDPKNLTQVQIKSPGAALLGNSLLLGQQSFMPPLLPDARKFTDLLNEKMPGAWQRTLKEKFPRYFFNGFNELPQEETAGLGLGVTLLLLAAMVIAIGGFISRKTFPKMSLVGLAAWVAVLFLMLKMGSESTARLLLPYYPLAIVPILLLSVQERLLRFRPWRVFAMVAALSVLPAIILSPARPLWPALSASKWLMQRHPDLPVARRLVEVYSSYAHRNDPLAPLRAGLPGGILKIGFFGGPNDTDYSLWRPLGLRRVEYLQTGADKPVILPDDLEWIVVKQAAWQEAMDEPLETWAARHHAKIILSVPIATLVSLGEQTWCVLQVEKP